MKIKMIQLMLGLILSVSLNAQNQQAIIKKSVEEQQWNLMDDFRTFLAIPNVAINPKGLQENAEWMMKYMKSKGIEEVSLLSLPNSSVPPVEYYAVP
jgi:hypothetical protein